MEALPRILVPYNHHHHRLVPFTPPPFIGQRKMAERPPSLDLDDVKEQLSRFEAGLKISSHKENIWEKLEQSKFLFLSMPTGSGKSLGIPAQMILNEKYNSIWISEPTIPATRGIHKTLVEHSSSELVGWGATGKFEYKPSTPIKVMTTGHMVNKCIRIIKGQENPPDIIMVDEIHTPTTENYMVFMLICHIVKLHPNLLVVVTSATLNCSDLLKHAPSTSTIYSNEEERRWPLDIIYDNPGTEQKLYHEVLNDLCNVLSTALTENTTGSGIVYLCGECEIEQKSPDIETVVCSFDEDMIVEWITSSLFDVDTAWPNDGQRRLYLCTNVAESSVTLNDIAFVIDTGFHKTMIQRGDTSVLQVQKITKANADQRAGRTGRTRDGKVYRMYTEDSYVNWMQPYMDYEFNILPPYGPLLKMYSNNLDPNILKMSSFRLLQLTNKLQSLKLLDDDKHVTDLGQEVVKYPISIPNATLLSEITLKNDIITPNTMAGMCMFIAAAENGAPSKLLFTPKAKRKSPADRIAHYDEYHKVWCRDDDLEALVYLVNEYLSTKKKYQFCKEHSLHSRTFSSIAGTYYNIVKQIPNINKIDVDTMDFDAMRDVVKKFFSERIMCRHGFSSTFVDNSRSPWIFKDASCLTSDPIPKQMCFMSLFVCEGKRGRVSRLASCGIKIPEPEPEPELTSI